MRTTPQSEKAPPPASETSPGIVDADIHHAPRSLDALLPYLSAEWRNYAQETDYARLPNAPYPKTAGGGVRQALPCLGDDAFYVVNSDVVLAENGASALPRLAEAWDGEAMDALLLLCPLARALGYGGAGDFFCHEDGRLSRRGAAQTAPFVFSGTQLLHPRLFADAPAGAYSLNRHYDEALLAGRLFGLVHGGHMLHVGSPEGLEDAERYLAGDPGGRAA